MAWKALHEGVMSVGMAIIPIEANRGIVMLALPLTLPILQDVDKEHGILIFVAILWLQL